MQEVYQISVIPSYKPSRGFYHIYTKDKRIFELLQDSWLPDISFADLPDDMKHLAIEPTYDEEYNYVYYVPNGTEDWEEQKAIVNGEEVYFDMSIYTFLDSIRNEEVTFPFIILGTGEAYTE